MNLPLAFAIIAIGGFLGGKIAHLVRLPAITGYLVAGIVMGPTVSGLLPEEAVADANELVTPIGLGIIAYLIGGSLSIAGLRESGRSIPAIVVLEGLFACVFVVLLMTLAGPLLLDEPEFDTENFVTMGILAGAISLATAPAATLALIEEAGARGRLVRTLLAVVAIDDGLAIIAFAVGASVIAVLYGTDGSFSPTGPFLSEMGSIGLSIVLGSGVALVAIRLSSIFRERRQRRWLMIAAIVALTGVADSLDLFPVVANMVLGFVILNRHEETEQPINLVRDIEGMVFVLFFTLAGTHLDVTVLGSASVIAVLITVGRMSGKFSGAWLGATISGAPPVVRRYLGFTLLPKAGITLGLALLIVEQPRYDEISTVLVSGVLASTLINELLAPPIAKFALVRAQRMESSVEQARESRS